ncbi:MAG: PilZ domain-containing protein [Planctomycetota bacterium]|nr:PilZ domain-containing protein [Planctomycetota bacterium]
MSGIPEQRRTPRYPVRVQLRLRRQQPGARWEDGILLTASTAGVFVQTACAATPGERVELELPLPQGAKTVIAAVQWVSAANPIGLGLAFVALPPAVADLIREAVFSGFWLADAEMPSSASDTHLIVGDLKKLLEEI